MSKRIFAAGRWPRGFYVEAREEPEYPDTTERIYVGGNRVGEALQELEERHPGARLAYEHHGDVRCGWCDRPLDDCRREPCDYYSKEADDAEAAD